mgnify:CR=1 FL=1
MPESLGISLSQLVESAPDAIVITDEDGRIRLVNQQTEILFGRRREELVGREVEVLVPARHRERHVGLRRRYSADPHARPMGLGLEILGLRSDGTEFPAEISLSPLRTGSGMMVTAIIRDMTERRKADHEFRAMARRQAMVAQLGHRALEGSDLRSLFDEAASLVAATLQVEFCSVIEQRPDGRTYRLVAGVGWAEGWLERDIPQEPLPHHVRTWPHSCCRRMLMEHAVAGGVRAVIPGRPRPFGRLGAYTAAPRVFGGRDLDFLRSVAHVLAAAIDRRRAEQAQRERDLLRADQLAAVAQVAAGVAHEIRNPLTSIKGLVQLHLRSPQVLGDAALLEDCRIIEGEIRRMERTLQTFLDFARPPKPSRRRLELAPLVDGVFALLSGRAAKQRVKFEFAGPDAPVEVEADADHMRQLLINLALNALDVMPAGGRFSVELSAPPGHPVTLRAADTGPGISPSVLPRLFEPFVSGKETGIGLGLAVSRRIAEDHGGRLTAENLPGGGASFTLTLPALVPGQTSAVRVLG